MNELLNRNTGLRETVKMKTSNLYEYNAVVGSNYGLYKGIDLSYNSALKESIALCRDLMIDQNYLKRIESYLNYNGKFLSSGATSNEDYLQNLNSFKEGVVLNNLFKKHINNIVTSVINGKMIVEVDDEEITEVLNKGNKGNTDYIRFMKDVLMEVMVAGSCLIFIDRETLFNFKGEEEEKITFNHYRVENIDTIRMDKNGNIIESTIKVKNRKGKTFFWYFYSDPNNEEDFRIYILDDGKNLFRTISYENNFSLTFPPVFLVSLDGIMNTTVTPLPPLIDVAHMTLAMYQEIGKRNYSSLPLLISRMFFSGMNVEDVVNTLQQTGSRAIVSESIESKAQVLESSNNHMKDFNENIGLYESMIESYINGEDSGNKLERETAEGVRNRNTQKNALICDLSNTAKDVLERMVQLIALILDKDYDNLNVRIEVGRELGVIPMPKDLAMFFYNKAQEGVFPVDLLDGILREVNVLPSDRDTEEFIRELQSLFTANQQMIQNNIEREQQQIEQQQTEQEQQANV